MFIASIYIYVVYIMMIGLNILVENKFDMRLRDIEWNIKSANIVFVGWNDQIIW